MSKVRLCPYCGTLMANPRRMQCGAPECKRRYKNARMTEWQARYKQQAGTHYAYGFKPHKKICETCGAPFESREARIKWCSTACANKARRWDRTCEGCHEPFQAKAPSARWCSEACQVPKPSTELLPWKRKPWWFLIVRAYITLWTPLRPLRKRWYSGQCIICGTWFTHDQPQTRTCTTRCQRKLGRLTRRARKTRAFVAPVSPWRIFERDKWRCQIPRCVFPDRRVARDQKVPHPKAPVLDHIIPLALGGTHEPANVQCAHNRCNNLKGATDGGDQLLLVG